MTMKRKPLLPYLLLSTFLAFLTHRAYVLYSMAPPADMTNLFKPYTYVLEKITLPPYFYWNISPLAILSALVGFFIGLLFYLKVSPDGNYRHGEESGSAKFATAQELKGFQDSEPTNNMIFSKEAKMGLFNKRLPFEWQLNKNVLVAGLPGDGKTYTYVKPNLMQMNSSFIVTDPKGLLVREVGTMLEENGYQIKVFDLVNLTNSDMFNPFKYMTSELDIDRITEAIVEGTKKGDREGEDFWNQAKLLLNRALIGYLYFDSQIRHYEPNLSMVADLLRNLKRPNEKELSAVEKMFSQLEEAKPGNYASRQWELFNSNFEADTRTSVLAIVATQYSIFDHDAVTNLIKTDTMEMDTWNTEKTAVFVAISETNKAYSFLASTFFTVIFDQLTHQADAIIQGEKKGYEPEALLHVQFIFDEFANVGKIPHFNEVLASIRSREMSIKIIIQAISQLDSLYGVPARKSMVNNCATLLFLGTNDEDTMKYFSMRAGKETITQTSYSEQRGQRVSGTTSHQSHQRDLMTPDEIARIGVDEALVFISKQNVFRDKKAMVSDHPMKDRLANHYKDKTWYHYKRFMEEGADFINAVMSGEIPEERVWAPDMSDYQAFVAEIEAEEPSQQAPETPVREEVSIYSSEMASESSSQTPEEATKMIDMETGEIFELPPEDQESYGEISLEDQPIEV
ncbi:VirD4-like conjugal transfer protein, CD1115 family [Streptococcus agalactiae]|uniref:VirD4-like conjugal transfer protein, CD1115 family n=1 Tax=Streptococcus agalactiae TaxID=1311 RepID=UPI001868A219|nr:type IV secretory system conjugative DNA transfer family protein [Streptococcus agalactiae]MBE3600755.1 type IV secretory system conjugative DNA transfer family protein [Streptococcus agalactiae]